LLNGKPLFPGRDYGHQLDLILDVIGTPTLDEFYGITSRRSRDYIRALPIRKRRPFNALFPKASENALDFLTKTLVRFALDHRVRLFFKHVLPADVRPQEADERRPGAQSSISIGLCKRVCFRSPEQPIDHLTHAQHDPEDEPVVASLDPEYFEFDSELFL